MHVDKAVQRRKKRWERFLSVNRWKFLYVIFIGERFSHLTVQTHIHTSTTVDVIICREQRGKKPRKKKKTTHNIVGSYSEKKKKIQQNPIDKTKVRK